MQSGIRSRPRVAPVSAESATNIDENEGFVMPLNMDRHHAVGRRLAF